MLKGHIILENKYLYFYSTLRPVEHQFYIHIRKIQNNNLSIKSTLFSKPMKEKKNLSRRKFIQTSAIGAAGAFAIPTIIPANQPSGLRIR